MFLFAVKSIAKNNHRIIGINGQQQQQQQWQYQQLLFYNLRLYFCLIKCFNCIRREKEASAEHRMRQLHCFLLFLYSSFFVVLFAIRQYAILSTYNFTSCRKLLWCRWRKRKGKRVKKIAMLCVIKNSTSITHDTHTERKWEQERK